MYVKPYCSIRICNNKKLCGDNAAVKQHQLPTFLRNCIFFNVLIFSYAVVAVSYHISILYCRLNQKWKHFPSVPNAFFPKAIFIDRFQTSRLNNGVREACCQCIVGVMFRFIACDGSLPVQFRMVPVCHPFL